MSELVLVEVSDGVGRIRLNRPEAANAINLALAHALQGAVDRVANDRSVRVVLITAMGKHFCGGGDVKWFKELGERLPDGLNEILSILNPLMLQLSDLPVPVVTAVQGLAAGAGIGLALVGDIVLAAESSKLLGSYTVLGLSPDFGGAYFLARRAGPVRAKDLFFFNRPVGSRQCLDWGIVNAVYPDDQLMQEAEKLALTLGRAPTQSLVLTKRLVDGAWMHSLEEQLALEREFMVQCGRSEDGMEGVRAFLEKREPQFKGR